MKWRIFFTSQQLWVSANIVLHFHSPISWIISGYLLEFFGRIVVCLSLSEEDSMPIQLIDKQIEKSILFELAKERFGDLVKAVVDVEHQVMVVGGELHSDEEAILIEQGSRQQDLWGINLYPSKKGDEMIEFDSIINLRPSQNNPSRDIIDPTIREKIIAIVKKLVRES